MHKYLLLLPNIVENLLFSAKMILYDVSKIEITVNVWVWIGVYCNSYLIQIAYDFLDDSPVHRLGSWIQYTSSKITTEIVADTVTDLEAQLGLLCQRPSVSHLWAISRSIMNTPSIKYAFSTKL